MHELLHSGFAFVCGQNPAHTWMPGGVPLPFCERCTGVYAGAAIALLLHWLVRPKLTGRLLELHGAFLLLMIPLGFHWVPQGPVLRTLSGLLFGAGLVTFLLPRFGSLPSDESFRPPRAAQTRYLTGLGLALIVVPCLAAFGATPAGTLLALLGGIGALVLAALACATLIGLVSNIMHWWRREPGCSRGI